MGASTTTCLPSAIASALGARATFEVDRDLQRTLDYTLDISPSFSLRGGTREILRNMIARDLGLR